MKNYLISILVLILNFGLISTSLAEPPHAHNHKDHDHSSQEAQAKKLKDGKLLIKVNGMVCAFCAQGIEKNFNAKKEVKSTTVDLDKMEVLITFNTGQFLPESTIKKIVTDAGFKYVGVK